MRDQVAAPSRPDDARWVLQALDIARRCDDTDDVPVGALVVSPSGEVLGEGWNIREAVGDPTGHAEMVALRAAARRLGGWRLDGCTLVVTLEPCAMCAGALVQARVSRVVFGAWDPKAGACGSVWDLPRDRRVTHPVEVVGGIRADRCAALLLDFFAERRD